MNDPMPQRAQRLEPPAAERSPGPGPGAAAGRIRCHLAKEAESGPGFTYDVTCRLRTRLRLAILIILLAFVLHLLRGLLVPGEALTFRPLWLAFLSGEILVLGAASAFLWSRRPLGLRGLRILELTIFGTVAAFFVWLQVEGYHDGLLRQAVVEGQEAPVFRLVGIAGALRWFLLIVLYGTFIPNTWRRCAAVVGVLALIPVVLMIATSLLNRAEGPAVLTALPDTVILMAIAVAAAVFGSHEIRELHEKAHEAERIGQYRLKRVLGFGGMGAVYLAEHVLLRRPCAIKLIRADQAGDPSALVRFEREVRATATLTHWNTIEIFDYGHTEDGTFYYVMEYLPGMNLEDIVDQYGPLPPERAVHLVRQVCQALREAHGIGLLHRDIKPSNIIACERGKVYDVAKLLDFGLVKDFGLGGDGVKLTREGAFAGSPAFMSPEQAAGREQLDARSDIYNVGAVAYYLVTGELLFDRVTPLQMLHAHAYEPLVPLEKFQEAVPADLQRVILRCLEKDPDRRFPDADSLDKALAACSSAGRWTPEMAEGWWRQRGDDATASPTPAELPRDNRTITVRR